MNSHEEGATATESPILTGDALEDEISIAFDDLVATVGIFNKIGDVSSLPLPLSLELQIADLSGEAEMNVRAAAIRFVRALDLQAEGGA